MLYIGDIMQERMMQLGLTAVDVADKTFLEEEMVKAIIDNEIEFGAIDPFDISLICNVLHCKVEFFTDDEAKNKDLLFSSLNRGNDNSKSNNVKVRIQDFINDFVFVTDILSEVEDEI